MEQDFTLLFWSRNFLMQSLRKTIWLPGLSGYRGSSISRFDIDGQLVRLYLKSWVYRFRLSNMLKLIDVIRREVSFIHPDLLHSAVAEFLTRLQLLSSVCGIRHMNTYFCNISILFLIFVYIILNCARHHRICFRWEETSLCFKEYSCCSLTLKKGVS